MVTLLFHNTVHSYYCSSSYTATTLTIESVAWLEKYLSDFKGTVVAITHDRQVDMCTLRCVLCCMFGTCVIVLMMYDQYAYASVQNEVIIVWYSFVLVININMIFVIIIINQSLSIIPSYHSTLSVISWRTLVAGSWSWTAARASPAKETTGRRASRYIYRGGNT